MSVMLQRAPDDHVPGRMTGSAERSKERYATWRQASESEALRRASWPGELLADDSDDEPADSLTRNTATRSMSCLAWDFIVDATAEASSAIAEFCCVTPSICDTAMFT